MRLVTKLLSPLALALVAGMATAGGPKVRDLPDGGYEMEFDEPIKHVLGWHEVIRPGTAPLPRAVVLQSRAVFLDKNGRQRGTLEPGEGQKLFAKKSFVFVASDFYPPATLFDLDGNEILKIGDLPIEYAFFRGEFGYSEVPGRTVGSGNGEYGREDRLYFFDRGRLIAEHRTPGRGAGAWSPDGRLYAVLVAGKLNLYDVDGNLLWSKAKSPQLPANVVYPPCFSPDGRWIWTAHHTGVLSERVGWLFDLSGRVVKEFPFSTPPVFSDDMCAMANVVGDQQKIRTVLQVTQLDSFEIARIELGEFASKIPGNLPFLDFSVAGFSVDCRYVFGEASRRPVFLSEPPGFPQFPVAIDWRKGQLKRINFRGARFMGNDWTVEIGDKTVRRERLKTVSP